MAKTVQKKENRRVRYTRMALRESLLALLQEMPINRITVSKVCEQADVNRSTFYLYYKDVYDLLDQIQGEFMAELEAVMKTITIMVPTTQILRKIYEVIYKNRDLCRVIFGRYGDKEFMKRIGDFPKEQFVKNWKQNNQDNLDEHTLAYLYTFNTYTNIGVIDQWCASNFNETPEQLAHLVSKLMMGGVSGLLSKGST